MHFHPADRVPARRRLWSLSEDVLVEVGPDGDHLVVFTQWGEIRIDDASPLVRESLQRMSLGPVSVQNLPMLRESLLQDPDGAEPGEPWHRLQPVLDRLGSCVVQSLALDDQTGPVLSVAPVARQARFWLPPDVDLDRPIRLSRFAALRPGDRELLLESPLTHYRVLLHRSMAAWVASSLACPTTVTKLSAQLKIAGPVLADIVAYLVASGVVLTAEPTEPAGAPAAAGGPARFAEDDDPDLRPWSHHDLQFHAHSRLGRQAGPAGAGFPYADLPPVAPVTRPRPHGPRFPLYRPALTEVAAADPPLTEVIEAIETGGWNCDYSDLPLSAEQLGELLFRVARIRPDVGAGDPRQDRPYPSSSGLYELDLYLSLDHCTGFPRGNYYYDPAEHTLTLISHTESELTELLDIARVAAGRIRPPPVLITITTRIARLSWLHSGIAYSATVKNLGALQQTLSLVASAMGLASCTPAGGDGAVADHALRLDWPAEVSVGEFVLGVPS